METAMTLASLVTDITSVFTAIIGWVGQVITLISSNPLLLFGVIATFAMIAIGVFGRLLRMGIGH